jgi:hypothetical protein
MLGTVEQPGVMVRALKKLFEEVDANEEVITKVTMSYLEVLQIDAPLIGRYIMRTYGIFWFLLQNI